MVVVVEEGKVKIVDIKFVVEWLNLEMVIGFVVNKFVYNDIDYSGYYGYYYVERSE